MPLFILALTDARLKIKKIGFDRRSDAKREARKAVQDGVAITATVFEDFGFLGPPIPVYRISKGKKQGKKPVANR